MRSSIFHDMSLVPLLVVFSTLVPPVVSWGTLGHRTVTAVALHHFSENHPVHNLLTTLLHSQEPTEASLFPDKIRYIPSFAYTAPWHYIDARDNPPEQCSINMTRDCLPSEGCVISAIANHTSRVADRDLPLWERSQSLRFMMHFFGDIHQPLHTENLDRGGNEIQVVFDHVKTNLHSVWDTLIPKKIAMLAETLQEPRSAEQYNGEALARWTPTNETETAYAWADFLYTRYLSDPKAAEPNGYVCTHDAVDCALEWASEVNQYVCTYVLKGGLERVQGEDLGGEYFAGAAPIIEKLIFKGGRRLAVWLDEVVKRGAGIGHEDEVALGDGEL